MQITVNADEINVSPDDNITYEAVVALAGKPGNRELLVKCHWFENAIRYSGTLHPGESIALRDGIGFRVSDTGNS